MKNKEKHPLGVALGELFRKIRETHNYAYQDVTKKTGVKSSYILSFEKANACLGAASATKLLSCFPIISYSSFLSITSIISATTEDGQIINEELRMKLFAVASHNNPLLKEVLDAYNNPTVLREKLEKYLFFTPKEVLSDVETVLAHNIARKIKENEKIRNIVYNLLEL